MNQLIIKNNPTVSALHSLFTYTYPADYKFHGESHNFYEVLIILSGSASVAADSNVFSLNAGHAILHPPMQFHNVISSGTKELSVAVVSFSGKHIPKIFNEVCLIEDISKVSRLFKKAEKIFTFNDIWVTGAKSETDSITFIKELELFLLSLQNNVLKKHKEQSIGEKNYSLIVRTLEEKVNENLRVKDIALLCNMSEIGLQKTFSRFAGVGVMEYFNNIKIRKAIELLGEGLSVKEAATTLGFNDPNYFSTVFKRFTGHSPSQLKK